MDVIARPWPSTDTRDAQITQRWGAVDTNPPLVMQACVTPAEPPPSKPTTPSPPSLPPSFPAIVALHPTLCIHGHLNAYLTSLHSFLTSFTYKSTPGPEHTPSIQAIKSQPFRAVSHTAEQIIAARLPIKCLEAVVVAIHLTHTITGRGDWQLTRFPLRFHSACSGHRYWHIVLVLQLTWGGFTQASTPSSSTPRRGRGDGEGRGSRFAAISLSRHLPLSFSAFSHPSLASLCSAFRAEYHRIGHHVLHVTVGLPIEDGSERRKEPLHWHFLSIPLPLARQDALQLLPSIGPVTTAEEGGSESDEGEEAEEVPEQGESSVAVQESEAASLEWRTVRGVLTRYSQHAPAVSHQLRINSRSPSIARPLPPLHPLVHWEPGVQQMLVVYRGKGQVSAGVRGGRRRDIAEVQTVSARGHRKPVSRERCAV